MLRTYLLSTAFLIALAACVGGNDPAATPAGDAAPPAPARPTAYPVGVTPPPGLEAAEVVRVVDGDTIIVSVGGEEHRLRYIGMDTPESVDPRRPVECFGVEASERNRQLVEGGPVWLEKDVSETDRFGRLLRYVWTDPSTGSGQAGMVNAVLVAEGYATVATFPPDVRYVDLFRRLEREAREEERGLWGPACASPTPSPLPEGVCEYSGTEEPVIKGNINRRGERIYHVPGGQAYDVTVIHEDAGQRWFCTEAEAQEAGWRRAAR